MAKKKWTKKKLSFVFGVFLFLVSQVLVVFVPYKTVPDSCKPVYDFVLRHRNKVINRLNLPIDLYPSRNAVESGDFKVQVYFAPSPNIEKELLSFISSASESIELCVFELNLQSVVDELVKKHKSGVDVRVIIDADYQGETELSELYKNEVPIKVDPRSAFMHNKFVVVDEKKVWTGSYNFTKNGTHKNDNNALAIESELLAENYLTEFNEMWEHGKGIFSKNEGFGPKSPARTPNTKISIGDVKIENYFAPEDEVLEKILRELNKASVSIHIMAFSFTSQEMAATVRMKRRSGLSVKALFHGSGAQTEHSQYKALQEVGADVYLSHNRRGVMHNKVIIIDRSTVITGSFNFSNNANKSNDENLLIIHSPELAAVYEEEFQRCVRGVKGY